MFVTAKSKAIKSRDECSRFFNPICKLQRKMFEMIKLQDGVTCIPEWLLEESYFPTRPTSDIDGSEKLNLIISSYELTCYQAYPNIF